MFFEKDYYEEEEEVNLILFLTQMITEMKTSLTSRVKKYNHL